MEAFEDKVNLDKTIQCPEDLWECPTQAILVGVVKDTAQEEPIIPEPGVEETTEVLDDPAQHFDDNLPSQLITYAFVILLKIFYSFLKKNAKKLCSLLVRNIWKMHMLCNRSYCV